MQSERPSNEEASVSLGDALFLAAKAGSVEDVEELLRRGVEANAVDHLGNTALHYAAGAGHLSSVLALLSRNPSLVNTANNVGDTSLHKAAWRGNREVVEALLRAGADTTVANGAGLQAFALAKDPSVAALLEPTPLASGEYPDDSDEEEGGGSDSD